MWTSPTDQKDQYYSAALSALTPKQRRAFTPLVIGAIFPTAATLPLLVLSSSHAIFWLAAFQLACVAGLSYIRWKSPAFNGSVIVLCAATVGCLASVIAAIAA